MAGTAHADYAARPSSSVLVQSSNGAICRHLPEAIQFGGRVPRMGSDRRACSRRVELDTVVAAQAREPNGGLIVMPDGFLNVHRAELISLAARHRLPAV